MLIRSEQHNGMEWKKNSLFVLSIVVIYVLYSLMRQGSSEYVPASAVPRTVVPMNAILIRIHLFGSSCSGNTTRKQFQHVVLPLERVVVARRSIMSSSHSI